jgi:hypothetical protein
MYACKREPGRGFSEGLSTPSNATVHLHDPPHSATQKYRSPNARVPVRRGSRVVLPWTELWPGVEVNHHPSNARAPLPSRPNILVGRLRTGAPATWDRSSAIMTAL